ncbi:MAG TPA: cupredoxin domain-containing protein [Candidatus Paceibacterota bacterium]|nr:cupredoxin domain-containing protein [Candidatus Paceibacterota bacterium]
METKITAISIFAAAILIGGIIIFIGWDSNLSDTASSQTINNVSMLDGKQIITISAKGGYLPRVTTAKADIPTIIKVDTRGTFDCSSALVIPSLGYRKNLPPSGETLIDVPPQKTGTSLQGLCAMGMYNFSINFN